MTTEPETIDLLLELVDYLRPSIIVEAGTWRGDFSLQAAVQFLNAEVWTADVVNELPSTLPANLHFHHGDFCEMLDRVDSFEFAYIDSGAVGGEPGMRLRHWKAAQQRIAPGGLIACHDMIHLDWAGGPEIAAESLVLPGGKGLGLWRAP